jgi:hypothetical protein
MRIPHETVGSQWVFAGIQIPVLVFFHDAITSGRVRRSKKKFKGDFVAFLIMIGHNDWGRFLIMATSGVSLSIQ